MANSRISKYHWVDTFIHSKLQPGKKALAAFHANFPMAVDAEWSFTDQHLYEVMFYLDDQSTNVKITPTGKIREIRRSIDVSEIDTQVITQMKMAYGNFYLVNLSRIEKGTDLNFEFTIDTPDRSRLLLHVNNAGIITHEEPLFSINAEGLL